MVEDVFAGSMGLIRQEEEAVLVENWQECKSKPFVNSSKCDSLCKQLETQLETRLARSDIVVPHRMPF